MSPTAISLNERQAIRSFEMGLQLEQLRMMVVLSKPATLYEAVTSARKYENMVSKKKPSNQSSNTTTSPSSTSTSSTSSKPTCENCHKVGHTISTCFKPKTVKPEPTDITCNYCKQTGHLISDCTTRKANNLRYRGDENYMPPRTQRINLVQTEVNAVVNPQNPGNEPRRAVPEEIPARIEDLV